MDSNAIEHTNMKRLIFIPLLIFSLTISAQFTKSGGTFLKSGNVFMTAPSVPVFDGGMISNGDFADGTDHWSVGTGWSVADKKATYDDIEANATLIQTGANMTNGGIDPSIDYRLTFTIDLLTSDGLRFDIQTDDGSFIIADWFTYTAGDKTVDFTTPGYLDPNKGIRFRAIDWGSAPAAITNIKLVIR